MEEGEIDMAGTVGKTAERGVFLHFMEPTYAKVPDQVFYLLNNSKTDIRRYEDLHQLNAIGVERGARVSLRFDQDAELSKDDVSTLNQLFLMLDQNRLDAFVGNEMVTDYLIKEMGLQERFKKARFRFTSGGSEYLAISKKSPHVKRIEEISDIINEMKLDGTIQKYIQRYTK